MLALAFPLLFAALQLVMQRGAVHDAASGMPLYAYDADTIQALASVRKVMVLLVTLDRVKTAGISESDAEIEHLATRARASALLPEVRVMAKGTSAGPKDYISDTGTVATSYFGPSYSIEGTLTFHLERLVYSGQEARLERLRLERVEARTRITQKVIDDIARWSKATAEERDSPEGTDQHADATARRVAAQMALDVWTAGWFSAYLEGKTR